MDKEFECLMFDADLPAGTIRLYAPRDFPLAGGIFAVRRIRTATDEDEKALSEGRADPCRYEREL